MSELFNLFFLKKKLKFQNYIYFTFACGPSSISKSNNLFEDTDMLTYIEKNQILAVKKDSL